MKPLTARQAAVFAYIRQYDREHGFGPSIRDITAACKLSSTSVADYQLRALEAAGYLTRSPELSRSIVLTRQAQPGWTPIDEMCWACGDVKRGREVADLDRCENCAELICSDDQPEHMRECWRKEGAIEDTNNTGHTSEDPAAVSALRGQNSKSRS